MGLTKLSTKIKQKRMHFASRCYMSKDEPVSKTVLLTPKHGRRKPGRPALTYTDILNMDTGLESEVDKGEQKGTENHLNSRRHSAQAKQAKQESSESALDGC